MKKFTKKQIKILSDYFEIYEDNQIIQLENWTDGGVDTIIYINKNEDINHLDQFKNFINNFDIDEEIEIHREDKNYRNDFSISDSFEDFKNYLKDLKEILKKMEA